jgi:MscS family membrane protein
MLFHVTLNLVRSTTPEQMRALLQAVTKLLRDTPKIEAGGLPVRFTGIGAYSLDIEIFVYITTLDGDEFMKIQQNLLLAIMDAVESAGTALALPTQASVDYGAPATTSEPEPKPAPAPGANGSRSSQPLAPRQS